MAVRLTNAGPEADTHWVESDGQPTRRPSGDIEPAVAAKRHWRSGLLQWAVVLVGYFLAGRLGLSLASVNPSASAVFPASGVALAALLLCGRNAWSAVFLGAFFVNVLTTGSIPASLAIAGGNTLAALAGSSLARRFAAAPDSFNTVPHVIRFIAIACALDAAFAATSGVMTLCLTGLSDWSQFRVVWFTWWFGDASGAVLAAPLIVLWARTPFVHGTHARTAELVALGAAIVVVGWIIVAMHYPVGFVFLGMCVWAAVRFTQRQAMTVAAVVSVLVNAGTIRGYGALGLFPPAEALLLVQAFMVLCVTVALCTGAAVMERMAAEKHLQALNSELDARVRARTAELEAALARVTLSEHRLAEAQQVGHVGSWEWTIADNREWWSDELYRMCGYEPRSFAPTYDVFINALPAGQRDRVGRIVQQAIDDQQPFEFEHGFIGPDGMTREFYSRGHVVTNEAGGVVRMVGATQDITEHRRLEQQLRQTQKMEAVGLLASGVAHDFNNLLIPIGGYSELVMSTLDERDPRHAEVGEIRKAAERAGALTRQLLAFSRRQVLQPQVLDLNALVGGIHKLLHRTIPARVTIVLELDPALDPVRADPGQLDQILVNLALNAADAMPDGGELRIATAMADVDERVADRRPPMTAGRYVKLTVSDTGIGMSADTQARLFEPFFTTKEPGRGTGMGLATVYGIVKQSGGFIWVMSQMGQGTTFEVYLPAVQGPVDSALARSSEARLIGGNETILVAEDDAAVQRLTTDVLQRHGYTVLQARDGEEALSLARAYAGGIDLLMTDIVMPGLSGTALARRLNDIRPSVRVLYSSGCTEYMSGRPAALDPSLPFLAKPYPPPTLLRTIRRVLDSGSPRVSAAGTPGSR